VTQIDAAMALRGCPDIFCILKIGSPNIDFHLIALRKITGDWGLFAGMRRRVTQGALLLTASDKKMGTGS
jgi:hypothetical protein